MWEELGQLLVVVSKVLSKEKLHCSSTARTDPWSYRLVGSRAESNRYVVVMEDKTCDQIWTRHTIVLNAQVWSGHHPKLIPGPVQAVCTTFKAGPGISQQVKPCPDVKQLSPGFT